MFVADEDGWVPEKADKAAVADERQYQGVNQRIPGKPGAAAKKRLQQRGAVGITERCSDEPE